MFPALSVTAVQFIVPKVSLIVFLVALLEVTLVMPVGDRATGFEYVLQPSGARAASLSEFLFNTPSSEKAPTRG